MEGEGRWGGWEKKGRCEAASSASIPYRRGTQRDMMMRRKPEPTNNGIVGSSTWSEPISLHVSADSCHTVAVSGHTQSTAYDRVQRARL